MTDDYKRLRAQMSELSGRMKALRPTCRKGHDVTTSGTFYLRKGSEAKQCRQCQREAGKRYDDKRRERGTAP